MPNMKTKVITITDAERVQTAKDLIIEKRRTSDTRASYELWGIEYGSGRVRLTRIDHAPTSGDFAPKIIKCRIRELVLKHKMVVEFRGAWKSDDVAKVTAYESQEQADLIASK